jgi:hypothetical protein
MNPIKSNLIKLLTALSLILALGVWCKKDELVPLNITPGIQIYKTKNDYFNNVSINLMDGKVYYKPSLWGKMDVDSTGTPFYRFRVKLHNGYILGRDESYQHTAFLSYTTEEYYNMETNPIQPTIPTIQELTDHIIDMDPFSEFFIDPNNPNAYQIDDTTLINLIIDEGKLQKFFKKVK